MELKYTNCKGEIVLARKLKDVKFLFLENCKNWVKKWIWWVTLYFFKEKAQIAWKNDSP